ncbi:MAG TPA: FKBP-type peptidyl-prolyl cis-trans isomerase [Solirubrobacteraceae bacterium]|nr:FKBP-type peptidyl-prolyl cis-trans isomerase [Solirubrobacteraceae bacterium]
MKPTSLISCACALLAAGGLAACGSSTAPGVQTAPSAGLTQAAATASATASATTSTATSSSAASTPATPTSGALSKAPTVTPPSGPAPSKLVVKDLIKGTGAAATSGQTVTVNYVGVLYKGGKEFDASWKRNQPFQFKLGQGSVISGWDQGVPGMKVGGRRELIIPAKLAYGAQGSPPTIPANAPLVFVIDLLGVS